MKVTVVVDGEVVCESVVPDNEPSDFTALAWWGRVASTVAAGIVERAVVSFSPNSFIEQHAVLSL